MSLKNRLKRAASDLNGPWQRTLCVCTSGIVRSPTLAEILSRDPYGFNTRSAGCVSDHALQRLDEVLVYWADEIVCMEPQHEAIIRSKFKVFVPVKMLDVPDIFSFRQPELIKLLTDKYNSF